MFTRLQEVRQLHDEKEFRAIHSQALLAAENLKRSEAEMIRALQAVDDKLVHRFLGYNSLFRYAVEALKLSEHQAYMYITVGRKAKALPQLQAAIDSKEITVSKASRITSVINEANQLKWIGLAATLPKRELEKEVASINPRAVTPERVRFLNSSVLQMETPISEEGYRLIERVRDLLSSSKGKPMSREKALVEMAKYFLEREDPVMKAERAEQRAQKKKVNAREEGQLKPDTAADSMKVNPASISYGSGVPKQVAAKPTPRLAFNSSLKHFVNLRDGRRCTFAMPDGTRCGESRWIEIHHIVPVALGGLDTAENLTTVCRAHHQVLHADNGRDRFFH